jgi:hypothetical protein
MSLSLYSGASFSVPGVGPDGSDAAVPSQAGTLEEAIADIKQASREFHDIEIKKVEVLPFAGDRELLVVYDSGAMDREYDPTLLIFTSEVH